MAGGMSGWTQEQQDFGLTHFLIGLLQLTATQSSGSSLGGAVVPQGPRAPLSSATLCCKFNLESTAVYRTVFSKNDIVTFEMAAFYNTLINLVS